MAKVAFIFLLLMAAGHTIKFHREKLAARTGLVEGIKTRYFVAITYLYFIFQRLDYTVSGNDIVQLVFFNLTEKQGT
jgi:hypothetical protein